MNRYKDAMQKVRFSETFDDKILLAMQKEEKRNKKTIRWDKLCVAAAALVIVAVTAVLMTTVLRKPEDLPEKKIGNPAEIEKPAATDCPAEEAMSAGHSGEMQPVSTLLMSINPEIEFQLDEEGLIAAVIGTNEDGEALLDGIDFAGYSFENAAIVVMNRLLEEGYITSNEIIDTITLKLGGENKNAALVEKMSKIITEASRRYDIEIETEQTAEDTVQLALKKQFIEEEETVLPEAEAEEEVAMTVEFILTGKVNDETTVGWRDAGGELVFGTGYTEVDTIKLKIGDDVYHAYEFFEYDTMTDWLNVAVMQTMNSMIKKEYISNDFHGIIKLELNRCTERQYAEAKEMVSMMLEQANLHYLRVYDGSDDDSLKIVNLKDAEGIPDMSEVVQHTPKYTLDELMDIRRTKDPDEITDLQMRILTLAFTEDGAKDQLKSRAWKVVPKLTGLTEEEAAIVCEQAGVTTRVVYEFAGNFDDSSRIDPHEYIGRVYFQDYPWGMTIEENVPFQISIIVDDESKAS